MKQLTKVSLLAKTQIAPQVYTLEFKRNFNFKPGQIIGLTNNPEIPPRLYSICSAPSDKNVVILFSLKTDGKLTPPLSKATIGDAIWISEAQGKFTYNNEPAWWIATGTGVAPFYSMFKSDQQPLKLIQGGRTTNDFYFQKQFEALPDYIKCCSQEKSDGYFEGRLTQYLANYNDLPTHINYYLCGSAEMVVDIRNLLINKGIPFSNIITEIYF